MSFWYPRLNSVGAIVGGNGTVTLRDGSKDEQGQFIDRDIGPGHSPQWMTDAQLLVGGRGDGTVIVDRSGVVLAPTGYDFNPRVGNTSGIGAGAGHWCGWSEATGLIYDGRVIDPLAAAGDVDQATGALYYLTPYQGNTRQIVLAGANVRTALATELLAGDQAAAWGEWEAVRRLYGWAPESGIVNLSPLAATEYLFVGVPVRTPNGLWLVTGTHAGLIVYPWGEVYGYVREGAAQFHHARWVNGEFVIVSTSDNGILQRWTVDLAAPRTDLRAYKPTTGTPVPPVEPPPIDPPVEPPTEPEVPHLTSPQLETLNRERDKYPKGEGVILTPQQIGDILNRTAWTHRNDVQPLGLQRKESGTAAVMPNGQHIWNGIRLIVREDGVSKHYGGDVCGGCSVGKFSPVNADFKTAEETGPNGWIDAIDPEDDDTDPDPPVDPADPELAARVKALEDQDKVLGMKDQELAAAILLLAGRVKELEDAPAASLPDDVVRTSTHEVKTPLTFSSPLTGRIQKKG